jgi:hypothetical protein
MKTPSGESRSDNLLAEEKTTYTERLNKLNPNTDQDKINILKKEINCSRIINEFYRNSEGFHSRMGKVSEIFTDDLKSKLPPEYQAEFDFFLKPYKELASPPFSFDIPATLSTKIETVVNNINSADFNPTLASIREATINFERCMIFFDMLKADKQNAAFFSEIEKKSQGFTLQAMFVEPVQYGPRYKMPLDEAKRIMEKQVNDVTQIEKAIDKVAKSAMQANNQIKSNDRNTAEIKQKTGIGETLDGLSKLIEEKLQKLQGKFGEMDNGNKKYEQISNKIDKLKELALQIKYAGTDPIKIITIIDKAKKEPLIANTIGGIMGSHKSSISKELDKVVKQVESMLQQNKNPTFVPIAVATPPHIEQPASPTNLSDSGSHEASVTKSTEVSSTAEKEPPDDTDEILSSLKSTPEEIKNEMAAAVSLQPPAMTFPKHISNDPTHVHKEEIQPVSISNRG